jgi:hypothetical protein
MGANGCNENSFFMQDYIELPLSVLTYVVEVCPLLLFTVSMQMLAKDTVV